jgi:hypothetical protein
MHTLFGDTMETEVTRYNGPGAIMLVIQGVNQPSPPFDRSALQDHRPGVRH